jgi:hypothetical protein
VLDGGRADAVANPAVYDPAAHAQGDSL